MLRRAIAIVVLACLIVGVVAVASPSFRLSLMNTFKSGPEAVNIDSIPGGSFPMPANPPANLFGMAYDNVELAANGSWQARVAKETGGTSSSFAAMYGLPGATPGAAIGGFEVLAAEPSTNEAAFQSTIVQGMITAQATNQSSASTWSTWAPPPTPLGNTFRCSLNVQSGVNEGEGTCVWYNGFECIVVQANTTSLTNMETLIESVVSEMHS
jgi:hypothetical protein